MLTILAKQSTAVLLATIECILDKPEQTK